MSEQLSPGDFGRKRETITKLNTPASSRTLTAWLSDSRRIRPGEIVTRLDMSDRFRSEFSLVLFVELERSLVVVSHI